MSTGTLDVAEDAAKEVYGLRANVQAIFCRRRHQPRRPPLAKIRPGRPAPTMGSGTGVSEPSDTKEVNGGICRSTSEAGPPQKAGPHIAPPVYPTRVKFGRRKISSSEDRR